MAKETWQTPAKPEQLVELDDTNNWQTVYFSDGTAEWPHEMYASGEVDGLPQDPTLPHIRVADVLSAGEASNLGEYIRKLRAAELVGAGLVKT